MNRRRGLIAALVFAAVLLGIVLLLLDFLSAGHVDKSTPTDPATPLAPQAKHPARSGDARRRRSAAVDPSATVDATDDGSQARRVAIELSGIVYEEDRTPVLDPTEVRLEIQTDRGVVLFDGPIGASAVFQVALQVARHPHLLRVRATRTRDGQASAWGSAEVWYVGSTITEWVPLRLLPAITIHGRTVDEQGRPSSDARVFVSIAGTIPEVDGFVGESDGDDFEVRSDAAGRFSLRTWQGASRAEFYTLTHAGIAGPPRAIQWTTAQSVDAGDLIVPSQDVSRWTLRFEDEESTPCPNVLVNLGRFGARLGGTQAAVNLYDNTVSTGEDGVLQLAYPVGTHPYRIEAGSREMATRSILIPPGPAGEREARVVLEYRPGIRIRIVGESAARLEDAELNVLIRQPAGSPPRPPSSHEILMLEDGMLVSFPRRFGSVASVIDLGPPIDVLRGSFDAVRRVGPDLFELRDADRQHANVVVRLHPESGTDQGPILANVKAELHAVRDPPTMDVFVPAGRLIDFELPKPPEVPNSVSIAQLAIWIPTDISAQTTGRDKTQLTGSVLWKSSGDLGRTTPRTLRLWVPVEAPFVACGLLEPDGDASAFGDRLALAPGSVPFEQPFLKTDDVRVRVPSAVFDSHHHVVVQLTRKGVPAAHAGLKIYMRRVWTGSSEPMGVAGTSDARGRISLRLLPGDYLAKFENRWSWTGQLKFTVGSTGVDGPVLFEGTPYSR